MMKIRTLLLILPLCLTSTTRAEDSFTEATRFIIQLYGICLQTRGDPETIAKLLDEQGIPKLTEEQARPFLGGVSGNAWPADTKFGKYVFSSRNDGLCTVYARWADAREVERALIELLERLRREAGGKLVKVADDTAMNGRHVLSFNLGPPTPEGFYLNLSASMLDDPQSQSQALLTYKVIAGDMPEAEEPKAQNNK